MLTKSRKIRKTRVRSKIGGTADRPRLSVFRSNKMIYAQAIDDVKGVTLVSSKNSDPKKVGEEIAKKLIEKKITSVVFDRSGYRYHGNVKSLAESAREAGLKF